MLVWVYVGGNCVLGYCFRIWFVYFLFILILFCFTVMICVFCDFVF